MLKQPAPKKTTMTPTAHWMARCMEAENIKLLNKALGDIQLTPREERTLLWVAQMWEASEIKDIISAFQKAQPARGLEKESLSPEIDR